MTGPQADRAAHILVAEDDPDVRRNFVRLLSRQGYTVSEAADGAQAHALVMHGNVDALLSDIGMPGMNGIELLQAVGATEHDPPVVLVTGNASLETAMQAVSGRAVAYLRKPASSADILAAIGRAVDIAHVARARRALMAVAAAQGDGDVGRSRAALDQAMQTVWMAYQPIVSVTEGRVFAFEALVRNDSEQLRAPPDLLEAASAQGRLRELGRLIRDRVADSLAAVPEGALVFVNLVAPDLLDEHLYAPASKLTAHATRVVLEITERDSLEHVAGLGDRLQQLRHIGFRLAVDDLGAGYSGLNALLDLRPDVIKLDMKLIRDIDHDAAKRGLVGEIVGALRRALGARLVAEGIETAGEKQALQALGLDLMQGYYFGRPARQPTLPDEALYR